MLCVINNLVKKIQKTNKEYILLFIVIIIFSFLIFSSTANSQLPPEEITLATYYPSPFGEFNLLRVRELIDYDNTRYIIDASGESRLTDLRINTGLRVDGPVFGEGVYTTNLTNGNTRVEDLEVQKLVMINDGPTDQRDGGKYVYDISEGISAEGCQKGDVVLISDKKGFDLVKSTSKFDARVAGVISEDPKIYMGQGEGKVPLALAGIVKCNATTENGPIKRGDLLVSSSLAGHAMRAHASEVKPGMLIGKALQPLETGNGKILILVNKQ